MIIDYKYIISVKSLMERMSLPMPRKKAYLKGDGEILPIIQYTVKGWDI